MNGWIDAMEAGMVDGYGGFDDLDYDDEYVEFDAEGRLVPGANEVQFGPEDDGDPADPLG